MAKDKKYIGNYLGIVVQNNDPSHRGRVKLFVPHVSSTVYGGLNKDAVDRYYTFPDKDKNEDLTTIIQELKRVLPWAECAAPLFGGSASGRYNAVTDIGSTSDANQWKEDEHIEGFRPAQNYLNENVIPDAFVETDKHRNRSTNPYAHQYTPSNYSNLARGMFTIPNVGSHVWVFFDAGDPMRPVYFAVAHGTEDFKRIYSMDQATTEDFTSTDYPASYENVSKEEGAELDEDSKTFRAKHVLNSNKHTIEFVDTDLREILKFTHFSGSFQEFTNYANISFASNNDQKMVMGDQFLTVWKGQNVYVAETQDVIIAGDQYNTIGTEPTDPAAIHNIMTVLRELHELKRLFDIQRIDQRTPAEVSNQQTQSQSSFTDGSEGYNICPTCKNEEYEPSPWFIKPKVVHITGPTGNSAYALVTVTQEEIIDDLPEGSLFKSYLGETGIYKGNLCDICNSVYIRATGGYNSREGFSPSTQDGIWVTEPLKETLPEEIINASTKLFDYEKLLGNGGDKIDDIKGNKVETIGQVFNDMASYRTDPIGKLKINGLHMAIEEVYPTLEPSPHIEYVDIDDVPGGDYNLTVGNKFKLLVGAGGVNIKTTGSLDIGGAITNITGEQLNISSKNEVVLDGGQRLSIRARRIALLPVEHNPVVVEGQLHVTRNMIVAGGAHIEGELSVMHITAPCETQSTYLGGQWYIPTDPAPPDNHFHWVQIPPHFHFFDNIPLDLKPAREPVRDEMIQKGINSLTQVAAAGSVGGAIGLDFNNEVYLTLVFPAADAYAKTVVTEPGFATLETVKTNGNQTTYVLLYNYNEFGATGPNNFKPQGLAVSVVVTTTVVEGEEDTYAVTSTTHSFRG